MLSRFFIFFIVICTFFYCQAQNVSLKAPQYYFIHDVITNWDDSSMAKKCFGKKAAIAEIKKLIPAVFQKADSNKFCITLDFIEAIFLEKSSVKFQTQIIDFTLQLKLNLLYKTEKGLEELNQFSFESSGQILANTKQSELQKYWKKSIQNILEKIDAYLKQNEDRLILPFRPAIVNVKYEQAELDNGDSLGFNSNRKLKAEDFKGKPDQLSKAGGATYCGFGLDYDLSVKGFKLFIEIKTICVFHKSRSWLLPSAKTNADILAHEQLHFDICYWQMKMFMTALSKENFTIDNLKVKVQKCYSAQFDSYEQLQEQYDEESNHGLIEVEQERWSKLVQEKIANL